MMPLEQYAIKDPKKATILIGLDTDTWDFIQRSTPILEITFDAFPDLQVIDIDFLKPTADAPIAFLSRVPRAWTRIDGKIGVFEPDDDAYGLSSYLLDIGEQISPLPLSAAQFSDHLDADMQHFNMLLTPSTCILRDVVDGDAIFQDLTDQETTKALSLSGFTSRSNPGGNKPQRLNAQMMTICDMLSVERGQPVELGKIIGSHSKK